MLYEINDKVKSAILQIVSKADIKGADVPIVVEILKTLDSPIPPEPTTKE